MNRMYRIGQWAHEEYDKAALLGALLALVLSTGILLARVSLDRSSLIRIEPDGVPGGGAPVEQLDLAFLLQAVGELASPAELPEEPSMLSSELRVFCVGCGKAIPYTAKQCPFPFCGKDQPEPTEDRDGDGMPDEWELARGFNPDNPDDALSDADGDGFTNLEEHLAETDPKDPKSHPPIVAKLRVNAMRQERFRLRFESIQELADSVRYTLNAGTRTYFARLGETVEGYTLDRYDADTRTLHLKAGSRQIGLPMRKDVIDDLITVELVFLLDGKTFTVRKDEIITIRGKEYRLSDLGTGRDRTVMLTDVLADKVFPVTEATEAERTELRNRQRAPFQFDAPEEGSSTETSPSPVPGGGVRRPQ